MSATTATLVTRSNAVDYEYDGIAEAFPEVDPGIKPVGTLVLVQIRQPKERTKGGVILSASDRSTDHYNTQVAKVIALGDLAFKTVYRGTDDKGNEVEEVRDWLNGAWYKPGDYVWVSKYGGDRFARVAEFDRSVGIPRRDAAGALHHVEQTTRVKEEVIFALYKAKDVHGVITGDPLAIRAYLD